MPFVQPMVVICETPSPANSGEIQVAHALVEQLEKPSSRRRVTIPNKIGTSAPLTTLDIAATVRRPSRSKGWSERSGTQQGATGNEYLARPARRLILPQFEFPRSDALRPIRTITVNQRYCLIPAIGLWQIRSPQLAGDNCRGKAPAPGFPGTGALSPRCGGRCVGEVSHHCSGIPPGLAKAGIGGTVGDLAGDGCLSNAS
jgi:hypothetical protein